MKLPSHDKLDFSMFYDSDMLYLQISSDSAGVDVGKVNSCSWIVKSGNDVGAT